MKEDKIITKFKYRTKHVLYCKDEGDYYYPEGSISVNEDLFEEAK